ncbi:MAG: hypothetical protein M5U12_11515 [Verrucomicrobia bacterium]|nr:hypothetical protein [Verrucomicrobiota bacterium]
MSNNSYANPLPWTNATVQLIIRDNPKATSDTSVVLNLRTSGFTNVYSIGQLTLLASPTTPAAA